MAKLTKKPINIPDKAQVKLEDNKLVFTGPKGELNLQVPDILDINLTDGKIALSSKQDRKRTRELIGTYQTLIKNSLIGVVEGHKKVLEYKGVGYQAIVKGDKLELKFGYSHPVEIEAPSKQINFKSEENKITISGPDKQMVGDLAAKIRNVRPVDPYKQKGIKYEGERVIEKEGKAVESMEEGP